MNIKLMENEHIIHNKNGKPMLTNKTILEQESFGRKKDKIPYTANIEKEFVKMVMEEYGVRGY